MGGRDLQAPALLVQTASLEVTVESPEVSYLAGGLELAIDAERLHVIEPPVPSPGSSIPPPVDAAPETGPRVVVVRGDVESASAGLGEPPRTHRGGPAPARPRPAQPVPDRGPGPGPRSVDRRPSPPDGVRPGGGGGSSAGGPQGLGGGGARPGNGGNTCTGPQLKRFIKSRVYVPMHELRRRFQIEGHDDDVTVVLVGAERVYLGLPDREGRLLGELLRSGDVGYELGMDPPTPIVVGVYPMRPIPRG